MRKVWAWIQRHLLKRSDVYFGGSLYMRRWRIGPRWFFGLRLHQIMRGDVDREFHDHPFGFVSLILNGTYVEHRPDVPPVEYTRGDIIVRKATDMHRLQLPTFEVIVRGKLQEFAYPVWTLVIRAPISRTWGFRADDGSWVPWFDFVRQREARFDAERNEGEQSEFVAASSVKMKEHKDGKASRKTGD